MSCSQVLASPIGATHMPAPPDFEDDAANAADCCESISIDNWEEMPLGIEVATPAAFCLADADGNIIGKTFLCKVVDESTGAETFEKKALLIGGGDPVPFDPAIHNEVNCDSKSCADAAIVNASGDDFAAAIGATANEIAVFNPACCEVVVSTSIGDIIIPESQSFNDEYDCPLTITAIAVTGDCDKSEIKFTFKNG